MRCHLQCRELAHIWPEYGTNWQPYEDHQLYTGHTECMVGIAKGLGMPGEGC